ncbi:MAG: gamma-glutamylcyclotransferase family protein [Terracidiphilus sp.]
MTNRRPNREPVFLAVYGTLMTGQANALDRGVQARMKRRGRCYIPGKIVEIGGDRRGSRYPGLILAGSWDNSLVIGELFVVGDDDRSAADVLRDLDAYEEYIPDNPAESEYSRRFVTVFLDRDRIKERGAWVYVYNKPIAGLTIIESGDWARFVKK